MCLGWVGAVACCGILPEFGSQAVDEVDLAPAWCVLCAGKFGAEFFYGSTGALVAFGYREQDFRHVRESVVQHEALHLGICCAAPVASGEECVTDRDFFARLIICVAGASDQ